MRPRRLLARLAQGHLQNVDLGDAAAPVVALSFHLERISGSHHTYVHPDVKGLLNLQDIKGQAKPYQLRQLVRRVEQYVCAWRLLGNERPLHQRLLQR